MALVISTPVIARADDLIYRYEGDVVPYDESAGWIIADPCDPPCSESVENGHFVLRWWKHAQLANYQIWIARPEDPPPPPTLWVEWRFRSNNPIPPFNDSCDANFKVKFGGMFEVVFLFANAAVSFSGDQFVIGLEPTDFHTFRYESLDGINYRIAVDGYIFIVDSDDDPNGKHSVAIRGGGGCDLSIMPRVNEWDFVRYGTISDGEQIVSSDPPSGFVDARQHAELDRFTVTYESPNYAYIDDITVEVSGGDAPVVLQTRRRENDEPDTVEIVLDRSILMGETTRFIFNDGVAVNVIEYTFAPADTDGDGDADLHDFAEFQRCFGQAPSTGPCLALDFVTDEKIDIADYESFQSLFSGP